MNMRISYSLVLAVLGSCLDAVVEPVQAAPFFLDKERGWFWRETMPEAKPPAKPEDPRKASPAPAPQLQSAAKPQASPPLSVAWLRKHLESYRERAIDDPTPENVSAYFYLQRVMLDKAHRFTDVAHEVVMADPLLDENTRRPISTFGAQAANRMATQTSGRALNLIAQSTGILFFFRSDCSYCHLQAPLLRTLEERYGFKVYAVSLDGLPMPGGLYPDFHVDQGQAIQLGVQSTPALFLLNPPGKVIPLAQGLLSLDELTSRILSVGHGEDLISDQDFETTRGQNLMMPLVTAGFMGSTPSSADDPISVVQSLRGRMTTGDVP